jgi:hypothetical protein
MQLLKELYEQYIKEAAISKDTAHKVYHADYMRKKTKKKSKK